MTLNFSNSDMIALAAVIIALCSLGATIWQGGIARSHNRRSVKPILVLVRERVLEQHGTILRFSVKNFGIGPGIVKLQNFTIDGRKFYTSDGGDYIFDLVAKVLGSTPHVLRKHGLPGINSAIPPGEHWVIAEIEFLGLDKQKVDELEKQINVEYTLHYECIYGRKHVLRA